MSLPILTQTYAEARRLAVAGSIVARGDFRLKKLLAPLAEAGKAAPVFAKIGDAATAVVEGPEDKAAEALLELTALTSAVLYTQGETGLDGKLEPIETADIGAPAVPTSARVLKPLLEALSSTGGGRLEQIKEAAERGLFRDMRLVKPALAGLDDPYAEIGDLLAEKVLPKYGKAILPELRAKYDPKGAKGHPRRLKLMHAIDPAGSRELVKQALDAGSKEVKVAAIGLLGSDPDDLNFLVEQVAAKSQDVRAAAYRSLARMDGPKATELLKKALAGKDAEHAADAIERGGIPERAALIADAVREGADALVATTDKKKVQDQVSRLIHLIRSFPAGENKAADGVLLDLFGRRADIAKVKSAGYWSGADVVETVIAVMSRHSKVTRSALVAAHAELTESQLRSAFQAGRQTLTPAKLHDTFAPYLTAKVDEKKKGKDPAFAKREVIVDQLSSGYRYWYWNDDEEDDEDDGDNTGTPVKLPPYDPRWLDLAVSMKHVGMVNALAKPGHKGALAVAKAAFDAAVPKAKEPDDLNQQVVALLRLQHPDAVEAYFAALGKRTKKQAAHSCYYMRNLVRRLPKSAIPRLEEFAATLPTSEADDWLDKIQELRMKA